MYNEMSLRFISKRNNIIIVRNMVGAMLVDHNPTLTFLNEMKTILSEAITNCIVHGYQNQEDKYIDMKIVLDDTKVSVSIEDYGVGIEDVHQAREPLFTTRQEEERSGLGFTIMESSMEVESTVGKGTRLYFEKNW